MSKKENMTETPEQDKKIVTRYDRRMQKRKEQEEKRKKEQKLTTIIGIVALAAVIALIASFPIRTFVAVNRTFVKIGGDNINRVEFDYNYYVALNNYYNQYGTYLAYMGIDLTGDLSQQMYSDTMTWEDFFQQQAVESIKTNKALQREADAAGFTYDTSAEYEEYLDGIREQASEAGSNVNTFLKTVYGNYATTSRLAPYVKEGIYLNAFYAQKLDELEPTDEEIEAHYTEDPASYDSVDYRVTQVDAQLPTEPTELADPVEEDADASEDAEAADGTEDGEEEAYQPSEAEIEAAMEIAGAEAAGLESDVMTDGELTENAVSTSINYNYRDWLYDEARKEGDTTVVRDDTNHRFFVVGFVKRYRDETPTVNARLIALNQTPAETVLNEWNSGDATEESFIELYKKYNEVDYGLIDGLYEGYVEGDLNQELSDWLYADERVQGNVTSIAPESGNQFVVYYLGKSNPSWYYQIKNSLLQTAISEYLTGITENVEVVDDKGNLNYIKVQEAAAAAAAASQAAQEDAADGTDAADSADGADAADGAGDAADGADGADSADDADGAADGTDAADGADDTETEVD